MSLDPNDDMQAAEFALGTLEPGERATLAARRLREPELAAAITDWERILAPLAEAAAPIEPPRDLLSEIETRIHGHRRAKRAIATTVAPAEDEGVESLQIQLRRWRATAVAVCAFAALSIVGFATLAMTRAPVPRELVAVLQRDADAPAFVVSVDIDAREFTARSVGAPAPTGKSYELWLIDDRFGAPRSLGLIDSAPGAGADRLKDYDPALLAEATFAVTVEPPGGSLTGAPSGPPEFVGKLIQVDP